MGPHLAVPHNFGAAFARTRLESRSNQLDAINTARARRGLFRTHLYHPHGQSSFLGQLFPYVPGRLRGLREGGLEDLELLGLYRRPRTATLRTGAAVVGTLVLRLGVSGLWVSVEGVLVLGVILARFRILETKGRC